MANIKELRNRIRSVGNIAQITRAMEMVASMKLRKVQARALATRPYTMELRALADHLGELVSGDAQLPLFRRREIKTTGIFLVTSDRGLCGAYNSNMLSKVHQLERAMRVRDPERRFKFFVYGRKGYTYLYRRGYDIQRYFVEPPLDKADFAAAKLVSSELVDAFTSGIVDEVRIGFTAFHSVVRFEPRVEKFLPVVGIQVGEDAPRAQGHKLDYLLEPDPETIFERLVPRYLQTVVYDAMLESLAAEYAARRVAMKGATDAATRMRKELRMVYNRARQENITKELLDIIGGASAVA